MYLVILLVASILLNLFLFIERLNLSRANRTAERCVSTQKRQVKSLRNSFATVCTSVQKQLQQDFYALEFRNEKEQEVLKFLLDKLPAVMHAQVESGRSHKQALVELGVTNEVALDELNQFFRTQDRDVKRFWVSNESDALLELCQLMIRKAQHALNVQRAEAS